MIDIHAHILPGIDDGAVTMEMTMEMLALAAESGVTDIVATPHCNIPDVYSNYVDASLQELCERVLKTKNKEGIPIRLHRGMEVFATEELPKLLDEGRVWTLGGSRYFLTEFSFDEEPEFCNYILKKCAARGYHPVVAHPERYYFLQEFPELAFEWCTRGYALQVNKGSLLGSFGSREQEIAKLIVSHGLAACVASDAHRSTRRSTYMREVKKLLYADYPEEYARMLLYENPHRMLTGQRLLGYEPIPI